MDIDTLKKRIIAEVTKVTKKAFYCRDRILLPKANMQPRLPYCNRENPRKDILDIEKEGYGYCLSCPHYGRGQLKIGFKG